VETNYLKTDMSKSQSTQSHESRAQLADFANDCCLPRGFECCCRKHLLCNATNQHHKFQFVAHKHVSYIHVRFSKYRAYAHDYAVEKESSVGALV